MKKGKLETFFLYLSLFPVLTYKEMLHIISEFFKRRGTKRKLKPGFKFCRVSLSANYFF